LSSAGSMRNEYGFPVFISLLKDISLLPHKKFPEMTAMLSLYLASRYFLV
jgi:hypothetical protein